MARNKYPEETVELILDVAARLFISKGYEKTSLQDIINETKLSKGAIYHHFVSKEEIFIRICNRIGEENVENLSHVMRDTSLDGREKLKEMFRASLLHNNQKRMLQIIPYLLDNPKFLAIQLRSLYEEVVPFYILPILNEGILDGSIQVEHPKELAEAILILSNIWLNPLTLPTTEEELRARCEVFIQMIRGIGIDLMDEEIVESYIQYGKSILVHQNQD